MLMELFINSPYAKKRFLKNYEDLSEALRHRQTLELRICREIFREKLKDKSLGDHPISQAFFHE